MKLVKNIINIMILTGFIEYIFNEFAMSNVIPVNNIATPMIVIIEIHVVQNVVNIPTSTRNTPTTVIIAAASTKSIATIIFLKEFLNN